MILRVLASLLVGFALLPAVADDGPPPAMEVLADPPTLAADPGVDRSLLAEDEKAGWSGPQENVVVEEGFAPFSGATGQEAYPALPRTSVATADQAWQVLLSGALIGESIFFTQRITSPGSYLFVNPYLGRDSPGVEIQGRSTNLAGTLIGPEIGEFQSGGQMLVYLYGQSPFANLYGVFFALAYGELKNEDWRFEFGLGQDIYNPLNPTTLNFGMGLEAGNTGFIRGHFRTERFLHVSDGFQITVQNSIGQPVITEYAAPFPGSEITLGENNGWPNIEQRVAFGFGESAQWLGSVATTHRLEIGFSGVIGQIRTSSSEQRVLATTGGFGFDLTFRLGKRSGIKGEFYKGQALGSYFGGSGQSINLDTLQAIRGIGGWLEVWRYVTPKLHTHWGTGIDAPLPGDVGINQRQRNQFAFGNVIWDATRNLQLGLEVSHYATDWNLEQIPSTEAFIFHSRVALKF